MIMLLKYWDGVLSPSPFMFRRRSALSSSVMAYAPVSLVFSVPYESFSGGFWMTSMTCSAVLLSSIVMTWANLVLSWVMPLRRNCASAWANQSTALSGQNGGSLTVTAVTLASDSLRAFSSAAIRSSTVAIMSLNGSIFLSLFRQGSPIVEVVSKRLYSCGFLR